MSTRLGLRVALLMTVPPLLWAGNAVLGRVLVGEVPPLTLNALRWGIAGLLLLPLGWRVLRAPGELLRRWKHLLLLGTLGVGMFNRTWAQQQSAVVRMFERARDRIAQRIAGAAT